MTVPVAEKRAQFRRLHQSGCFVMPNPWDVGSARYLQSLGFKALATTSAGFAWSTGRPDGAVPLDEMLAHFGAIAAAVDVPINADFANGLAADLDRLAANVGRAAATGVAGLSIEDATGDKAAPLYDRALAVERIRTARAAIDRVDPAIMLVGRAECYWVGQPDLAETIARLVAYAEAGADCLYAPALKTKDEIAAVVRAVAPKPVNVLVASPSFTVAELAEIGVRRISTGGALARSVWAEFMRIAGEIAEAGVFAAFASTPKQNLNGFFAKEPGRR